MNRAGHSHGFGSRGAGGPVEGARRLHWLRACGGGRCGQVGTAHSRKVFQMLGQAALLLPLALAVQRCRSRIVKGDTTGGCAVQMGGVINNGTGLGLAQLR